MVMVAKNQNRPVEGREPAQSVFVPYSFPAGNESPAASSSSSKKNLLTIVDWLNRSRSKNPKGDNWGRAAVAGAPAAGGQTTSQNSPHHLWTITVDDNALIDLDGDGRLCAIAIEHASQHTAAPWFSFEQISA